MATVELCVPFKTPWHHNVYQFKICKHKYFNCFVDFHVAAVTANVNGQSRQKFAWKSADNHLGPLPKECLLMDSHSNTYDSLLQACTTIRSLNQLHAHFLTTGLHNDIFLQNKLVTRYAMCGSMENSRLVFDKMYKPSAFLWNAMIREYVTKGLCYEALTIYYQMQRAGIEADNYTFSFVLKACAGLSALQEGKEIHVHIVTTGFSSNIFVGNSLLAMYMKCSRIEVARQLFDKMPERDMISWNTMIAGYTQNGHAMEAWDFFNRMQLSDMKANPVTMVSLLHACAQLGALEQGKCIHDYIIRRGFESDVFVRNSLLDMYSKCGSVETAGDLFDKMPERNVVSWNAMIAGYAQNGHASEALTLFHQMQVRNFTPDLASVVSVLQACAQLESLQHGKRIHDYIIQRGFQSDILVKNSLVFMYAKCRSVETARELFDNMTEKNVFSWNAMIVGYAQNGYANDALTLFHQMQLTDIMPDSVTLDSALQACARLGGLQQGKEIHGYAIRTGFESGVFVGNSLVAMYGKCGSVQIGQQLFDKMSERNVVSWNAIIAGYAHNGYTSESLGLFYQMQLADKKPDPVTMVSVLQACALLAANQKGQWVHGYIIRSGFESDIFVKNSLIAAYAKWGSVDIAQQLFDSIPERNVISWNAMIAGYAQHEHANEALILFHQMQQANMTPDLVTMGSVLQACAQLGALQQGQRIHNHIIKSGLMLDVSVGTALVDMYAKCGNIETARQLFDKMPERNVVSWNAMIAGYAQNGYANEAWRLFHQMQLADKTPDSVTMVSVVQACAHLGALHQGKWIHDYIVQNGFEPDVFLETALVDMYAKCGSIDTARHLFDKMLERNVVSWNAMIAGYGMHGHGTAALAVFSQMQQAGVMPNHITFICVLSACSHAGLVNEGWQHFDCMSRDYCITRKVEHYACMVDLLGRAGHLDEARDFILNMPLEPDANVWGALLSACRIHSNIELGKYVAELIFDLEPENAGYYVLLSNIYAAAGRWDDVIKVRTVMQEKGLKKTAGCSFIEVNDRVHAFLAGDTSHPQSEKIYATLEILAVQMDEIGYVPNTNFVLHDVEEEIKEHMLGSHSEKLAIAFGLINTSPGTPIRITKNLRVCGDCHSATKFISKIVRREIIVRDANRFHHFTDGLCSCRDYW